MMAGKSNEAASAPFDQPTPNPDARACRVSPLRHRRRACLRGSFETSCSKLVPFPSRQPLASRASRQVARLVYGRRICRAVMVIFRISAGHRDRSGLQPEGLSPLDRQTPITRSNERNGRKFRQCGAHCSPCLNRTTGSFGNESVDLRFLIADHCRPLRLKVGSRRDSASTCAESRTNFQIKGHS